MASKQRIQKRGVHRGRNRGDRSRDTRFPSATKSGPGRYAKHGKPESGRRLFASYAKRYATV